MKVIPSTERHSFGLVFAVSVVTCIQTRSLLVSKCFTLSYEIENYGVPNCTSVERSEGTSRKHQLSCTDTGGSASAVPRLHSSAAFCWTCRSCLAERLLRILCAKAAQLNSPPRDVQLLPGRRAAPHLLCQGGATHQPSAGPAAPAQQNGCSASDVPRLHSSAPPRKYCSLTCATSNRHSLERCMLSYILQYIL